MKKSIILFVVAFAAISCTKSESEESLVTFRAGEVCTKLTLIDNVKIRWVAGDKVSVFDDDNLNKQFTASTSDGGISATLTGQGKFSGTSISKNTATNNMSFDRIYYASFPYNANTTIADGVFSFSSNSNNVLSANQLAVNGNFAKASKAANNAQGVYVAKSDNGFFLFKPATAFIKFTITQSDIKKIRFNNNGNSPKISGAFLVDYTGPSPVVSIDPSNANGNEVVFGNDADFATAIAPGTYIISVLPSVFNKGTSGIDTQLKLLIHTENVKNGQHVKEIYLKKHFSLNSGDIMNLGEIGHD